MKILLVDDSSDSRMLIEAHLAKTPHQIDTAGGGEEAVETFKARGGFDLVFMDVRMPDMDGYAATRAIRGWEEEEGRPPARILALSAHAMEEEIERSLEAGCDAHLTKPVEKERLLDAVREAEETMPEEVADGRE
jgi:CheY-like chemotaxis protein